MSATGKNGVFRDSLFETFWSLFRNSAQHAPSLHKYLILPIVIFLLLGAFCKRKKRTE